MRYSFDDYVRGDQITRTSCKKVFVTISELHVFWEMYNIYIVGCINVYVGTAANMDASAI